jgi:hypothetical protein
MFFNETKKTRFSLILLLFAAGVFIADSCYADITNKSGYRGESNRESLNIAPENRTVENLFVEENEEVSLATTLLLDFAVPGGGHFYRGDYVMGGVFLTLKIAGGFMAYYFVKNWKDAEESYYESKSAGVTSDELAYKRRLYDRSAQYVTFAAAMNLLVYGVSALINYNGVTEINERAFPVLNISLSGGNNHTDEFYINCGVNVRI